MKTVDDLKKQIAALAEGSAVYISNNCYTTEQANALAQEGVAEISQCPLSGAWLIGRSAPSDPASSEDRDACLHCNDEGTVDDPLSSAVNDSTLA
jgi:hypothetical protein